MTSVDDAYTNFVILANAVKDADFSALNFANEIGAKTLLIAAAGDLERRVCKAILEIYASHDLPEQLLQFVEKQALERKFHAFFAWDTNNANRFLSLFGPSKKEELSSLLKGEPYKTQMNDFLFIGRERNNLAHNGLTATSLPNTIEEIYEKYRNALQFVNLIRLRL